MAKQKTHEFIIRVRFDKPCSAAYARWAVRDNIHGEFYPTQILRTDPGAFKVSSFKPKPRRP